MKHPTARAFVDRPFGDRGAAEVAARTASEHWGLADPVLLRMGMNAIFVAGAVILRVARPSAPGAAAIELHEVLRSHDVPVTHPARSDVVQLGDVSVTCWERIVEVPVAVDWHAVGEIVRRVHGIPRESLPASYPLASPSQLPWWDFDVLLADVGDLIDASAREGIDAALARWDGWEARDRDEGEPRAELVVCHGDVHPGNVMTTAKGPVLIDWDLLSSAPACWDHAPMMTWTDRWGGAPGVYEAFARGYGRSFRADPIAEGYAELRLVAATLMRLRAGRTDPLASAEAERRLAYWRGDPDAPSWRAQ